MTLESASILREAGDTLGGFLPRLGGAIVLVVVGFLVARLLSAALRKALEKVDLDALAERWGVHDALERVGLERSLTRALANALRIALRVVVLFAALSLLGLQFLSQSLNAAVLFLPNLLIAAALVLAGIVLGGIARERVDRTAYQMDLPVPLGAVAQAGIIAVFGITAAAQLHIPTNILALLLAIVVGGIALMLAIAFGLGGREVARALSASRYVRGSLSVGQTISVGDVRGEITAIEPAATVLRTSDGDEVRVPNHLLVETMVRVHADAPGPEPEAAIRAS
jgi:small-conductance mechanosensitive channel